MEVIELMKKELDFQFEGYEDFSYDLQFHADQVVYFQAKVTEMKAPFIQESKRKRGSKKEISNYLYRSFGTLCTSSGRDCSFERTVGYGIV